MALFVFGAGASRGASFVDPSKDPCLPPLDADFFTQLQRIQNPKHQKLVSDVIKDTVELFGNNFTVTLEQLFTTLEHTMRMVATTGENRDFRQSELKEKRDRLLQAVAAAMEESLTIKEKGRRPTQEPQRCKHHNHIVQKIFRPADEILSFNYDCLLDCALKESGDGKWNARYGYGFALGSHGSKLTGDRYWSPQAPSGAGNTIEMYKLHGSLHFDVTGDAVKLKQRPYTKQSGKMHFTIIPPEYHKEYDKGVFRRLWRRAGQAIHKSSCMIFIGYSLPTSDLHSTALFQISVRKKALKSLVIVNPDRGARQRTRSVLQRGISDNTRILVFDTLRDFVSANRMLWDR